MKKVFALSLLIVCSLTGCKKDYTCECPAFISGTTTFVIHDTHSKAEQRCKEQPTSAQAGECKLK